MENEKRNKKKKNSCSNTCSVSKLCFCFSSCLFMSNMRVSPSLTFLSLLSIIWWYFRFFFPLFFSFYFNPPLPPTRIPRHSCAIVLTRECAPSTNRSQGPHSGKKKKKKVITKKSNSNPTTHTKKKSLNSFSFLTGAHTNKQKKKTNAFVIRVRIVGVPLSMRDMTLRETSVGSLRHRHVGWRHIRCLPVAQLQDVHGRHGWQRQGEGRREAHTLSSRPVSCRIRFSAVEVFFSFFEAGGAIEEA